MDIFLLCGFGGKAKPPLTGGLSYGKLITEETRRRKAAYNLLESVKPSVSRQLLGRAFRLLCFSAWISRLRICGFPQ
jgi:hypothetical protein